MGLLLARAAVDDERSQRCVQETIDRGIEQLQFFSRRQRIRTDMGSPGSKLQIWPNMYDVQAGAQLWDSMLRRPRDQV
jgi:hypothetical protein